jgi:hypothetical protein
VAKLEGQWWFDRELYGHLSMAEAPQAVPRDAWQYRLLLRLPDFLQETDLLQARASVIARKPLPHQEQVHWFPVAAHRAVQLLHLGPFDREPETLARIQQFLQDQGLSLGGPHREIYLSDPSEEEPRMEIAWSIR